MLYYQPAKPGWIPGYAVSFGANTPTSIGRGAKIMDEQRALTAHLLRRAGFGATPQELDEYLALGDEATVE